MILDFEETETPEMKRRKFFKAAGFFTTSLAASVAMYVGFNWHVDRALSMRDEIPSAPANIKTVMDLDTNQSVMKRWSDESGRRFTFGAKTTNDGLPLEQVEKLDAFYDIDTDANNYLHANASLSQLSLKKKVPLFGGLLHAERSIERKGEKAFVEETKVSYGSKKIMEKTSKLSGEELQAVSDFQALVVFCASNIFDAANAIAMDVGEKLEAQALLESVQDMRKHFGSTLAAEVLTIKDPAGVVCDDGIYYLHANNQVAELSFEEDGGVMQSSRLADGGLCSVTAFESGEVVVEHQKIMPDGTVSVLSQFLGKSEEGWSISGWFEKQVEPKGLEGVTLMTQPYDARAVFTKEEMLRMGNKVRSNAKLAVPGGPTKPSYLDQGIGTLSKAEPKNFKFG